MQLNLLSIESRIASFRSPYQMNLIKNVPLHCLKREIRRWSRSASPFRDMSHYLQLIACYLIEYTEDWSTDQSYISALHIEEQAVALL